MYVMRGCVISTGCVLEDVPVQEVVWLCFQCDGSDSKVKRCRQWNEE